MVKETPRWFSGDSEKLPWYRKYYRGIRNFILVDGVNRGSAAVSRFMNTRLGVDLPLKTFFTDVPMGTHAEPSEFIRLMKEKGGILQHNRGMFSECNDIEIRMYKTAFMKFDMEKFYEKLGPHSNEHKHGRHCFH